MQQADYWNERYTNNNFPWDIGYVSTPIKEYIDQIEGKEIKILIPGAGNAHEAIYLYQQGFKNVYVCDWAEAAFNHIKKEAPYINPRYFLVKDFFELGEQFDLIIEQTFFCAITPDMRDQYVQKMHELLNDGGKLVGLLFSEHFDHAGPPHGGSYEEYYGRFEPYFDISIMEKSYNSIKPRMNRELFMVLKKKHNMLK